MTRHTIRDPITLYRVRPPSDRPYTTTDPRVASVDSRNGAIVTAKTIPGEPLGGDA